MNMLERILVPLDGSELAEQVLPTVVTLARAFHSEVLVLGVAELGAREQRAYQLYADDKARDLKAKTERKSASVKAQVVTGKAAEMILTMAEEERCDLIVMASHGQSGVNRWPLGSTSDRVLRSTRVPLMMVRTGAHAAAAAVASAAAAAAADDVLKRVLVPIDGSERSEAILPFVENLVKALPSEVIVAEIVEEGMHVRTVGGLDYVPLVEKDLQTAMVAASQYLESITPRLGNSTEGAKYEVATGDPARELIRIAAATDCTMIAMTSHGRSGIETLSLGSVASKVIEGAQQSIWIVPSFSRG
jgi:nucleotide-binding universal stress UspA family protein